MIICVNDCRINDEKHESHYEIITRMLEENNITINYDDDKMLKYYTVKVKGFFTCKCGNRWTSHKTTIKIDLYRKRLTKVYRQKCKRCRKHPWVNPSIHLTNVMEKIIYKYKERKDRKERGDGNNTVVDCNVERGNPRAPHEESLCERCEELGRPCW